MTTITASQLAVHAGSGSAVAEDEAGGKGAALDRLTRAGFPVPPTALVTSTAYRAVAATSDVSRLLKHVRAGYPVPAAEVDAVFLAAPIPDAVRAAIVGAAVEVGGGGPVAIRSSATVEDLAAASFAGQYRSTLDVQGTEAVLRAVRLTWASLWHPAPCSYRRAWGIGEDGIAMAVVIMRMVPAVLAGVAFTADPGGAAGCVRVEAVAGLGESLVSGERTPDVWLVPGTGAPAGPPVPHPVLEAAAMARRVEDLCAVPQDVEWAWDGARLWLVQARPITAGLAGRGDDCETPVDGSELTTNGIGEMLPGVLPPLLWDVNRFLVEEALRNVFGELRALPADLGRHDLVRRVHGRAALDLDAVTVAARATGGSEDELRRQYFGTAEHEPVPPGRRTVRARWRRGAQGLRAAAVRRHANVESDIVAGAVAEIGRCRHDLAALDDDALLAYRRRLVDFGARAMTVELAVAAAAVATYQQLEQFLGGHLGERAAASAVQRVTVGAGAPVATGSMSRAIFAGPTWTETGRAPAPAGRSAADRREAARRSLEQQLRSRPSWRRTRILTGQIVDVRLHLLRRLILDATDGLTRRERTKAAVLELGGEARRVQLEIGNRLAGRGALTAPGEVDLLRDRELEPALRGDSPPPAVLAHRRRLLDRWWRAAPLPARFTGSPPLIEPALDVTGAGAGRLAGWAASPGRHTGRARVVTDPLRATLALGDVLVAAATDAGWSPLFTTAGAIVVERGGPLSHAAIVARELGVPAVLNVAGATVVLDGRLVTVDGDAGLVSIHAESGGAP